MQPMRRFDHNLTKYIQELPASWKPLMAGITFLGEPLTVLSIGFAGFLSAVSRHQNMVEQAFFYCAVAYALNTALKLLLHRRRPHNLTVTTLGVKSYSFPSGHAFGTMIFYGLFAYLDYTYLASPWNWLIAGLIAVLIALIGISRVYLKAHYPTDVIGGWLLGLVSLVIIINLAF